MFSYEYVLSLMCILPEMVPYYRALIALQHPPTSPGSPSSPTTPRQQIPLPEDDALLERMEAVNAEELKKLDERLEEAEKTEGESEIADALRARANYFTRIGDKVCTAANKKLNPFLQKLSNRRNLLRPRSWRSRRPLALAQKSTLS